MRDLIGSAKCVLFDFDGPVCRLFHHRPAPEVAERLRGLVPARWLASGVVPETGDPHMVMEAVFAHPETVADGTARVIEAALTDEEVAAAPYAFPTLYADSLVRTLHSTGRKLAITTNNSQLAVERYLQTRLTGELFAGHVHGRSAEGEPRLKPDPDCLLRALSSTGAPAEGALMIGDAPRDLEAARAAGVAFLGYARNQRKAAELSTAGAEHVVRSLRDVLKIVDPGAHV